MIKAVIFDMDGLLIDSEPLWEEAEKKVFSTVGVPMTTAMTKETMGMRTDEVVEYWYHRYPWTTPTKQEVQAQVIETVIRLIESKGTEKGGVREVIELFQKRHIPMALASSSAMEIIRAVLKKLSITGALRAVCSAEHEPYGKPHPGVYISTAQKLNIPAEFCLAFEDSPNGVLAAKAAKMKCVAVPDPHLKDDDRFCIADANISSLTEFSEELFEDLNGS